MEVDEGIQLEETKNEEFSNSSAVKLKKEYEECIGCDSKKFEVDEAIVLKQRNDELEKSIRNLNEEHDELMIENKVLECEKNKAETEAEIWKAKCKELENEVMELKKRLSAGMMQSGLDLFEMYSGGLLHGLNVASRPAALRIETENKANEDKDASGAPPTSTPSKQYSDSEGFKGGLDYELKSTVRKCPHCAASHNSTSPTTPDGKPPFNPVDISDDSDDDLNSKRRKVGRGVACVVTSESETDDDIPICRLKSKNQLTHSSDTVLKRSSVNDSCFRTSPRKRRLRWVGDHEGKGDLVECSSKNNLGISENLNSTLGEDEMEDDDSSSEGESLGGFIVGSSESSETDSGSNCNDMSTQEGSVSGDCSGESENATSDIMAYQKVISGFRRERKHKLKWDYEADMLADFAKCPELCMKAVCAVYRQQTTDEKFHKATILRNGRGFSTIHALCGSALAEFLTDGDPRGDVKKSVKELDEFNSKGVEQCRKLAIHYSKQLFEIYQNKEDPFLHP